MKIATFSIVIGGKRCNARCPFCISRQTGFDAVTGDRNKINLRNFKSACRYAQMHDTTTVLMTGKGEPTLFPEEITAYLEELQQWPFAFYELQTNGLAIGRLARDGESGVAGLNRDMLELWRELGLNTIAVSVVSADDAANARVYHPDYPPLVETVGLLREMGFTVRLCIMMMRGEGCVATPADMDRTVEFCRKNDVGQLTIRPIRKAYASKSDKAAEFVEQNGVTDEESCAVSEHVAAHGRPLLYLSHGAVVYDVGGQNVCVSDCLTVNRREDGEDIRTLIFYSDGRLAYDWQHEGALILQGDPNYRR